MSAFAGALAAVLSAALAHAAPDTLDAATDERLLNELAARDLGGLLDRAFTTRQTPDAVRRVLLGRMDLLRTRDRPPADLLEARRVTAAYVEQLPKILPSIDDPATLIGDANLLIDVGVAQDQSLLEYFGPSPGAIARLRPAAAAVRELLAKAAGRADTLCQEAMNDWPARQAVWEAADQQKAIADYTRAIVAYPQAIATGVADPGRDALVAGAIRTLNDFDTDDNPDRASVKFYAAKLNLARGTPASLAAAADGFAFAVVNGRRDDVRQQFDARLLTVGVRLAQKRPKDAVAAADVFLAYANAAGLDAGVVDVALAGVRYRQALADARPGQADAELERLLQKRPELRGLALELIAARADDAAPADSLGTLALQARMARAEGEALKPAGRAVDAAALKRGIDAARVLLGRPDAPGRGDAAYVLPFFLAKSGDDAAAATGFLDYVDANKSAGKTARLTTAFEQAVAIVGGLFRARPDDPVVTALYDRTLATAVAPPLARGDFAYEYARRLQAKGQSDAAVAAYRTVPAGDRNYSESRYFLMLGLRQRLEKLDEKDSARRPLVDEATALARDVLSASAGQLKSPDARTARVAQTRLANTSLFVADLLMRQRDDKDAAEAVRVLEHFEAVAKNLPGEANLLGEALLIRVQAYVQLNDVDRATGQLVALAKQNPAGAGQVVYNLLEKLDRQVNAAEAAGRNEEVGRLERNRALLTPFLVRWAEGHADDRIRRLAYTYKVFDADTQRRAAENAVDPADRKRLLEAANERFVELADKPALDAYLAALPPEKRKAARYDPQVTLGLARVEYAQGHYAAARLGLATLFSDKLLGSGVVTDVDASGTFQTRDNPAYWEALLKLIRSNLLLGENGAAMKGLLAEQNVIYGGDVGGKRWAKDFAALRDELGVPAPTTRPD